MIKITALLLAVLLAVGIIPTLTVAQAQENATSTTNTTTTETNMTIPVENNTATQLPVFPEPEAPEAIGNQTTTSNQTEQGTVSADNATKVLGLLDEAQVRIDEARDLIRGLQAQIEAGKEQPGGAATNDTDQIIQDANDTATDITDIVETNLTDSEVIGDVGNITEDIEQAINDTIQSNPNATSENIENITEEAIEVVENATDNTENSTIEAAVQNGMIRLLSGLVSAQDYNQGLSSEERDDLKANLQDAIAELAGDAADSLRN
jgi:hypothetical protein